ncbi:testis-expressed protein 50-like isoform X2 [Scyliorhinus canicula]|uniref:testis-expressed protein 50-like isoform X2 n=1 Tax=Scyliorhinus canicula TaxID=7830 RepID=UPI0018F73646|nr:testis-expressed protein 50-like isoform X2 [Scyliorhinus canicula]
MQFRIGLRLPPMLIFLLSAGPSEAISRPAWFRVGMEVFPEDLAVTQPDFSQWCLPYPLGAICFENADATQIQEWATNLGFLFLILGLLLLTSFVVFLKRRWLWRPSRAHCPGPNYLDSSSENDICSNVPEDICKIIFKIEDLEKRKKQLEANFQMLRKSRAFPTKKHSF